MQYFASLCVFLSDPNILSGAIFLSTQLDKKFWKNLITRFSLVQYIAACPRQQNLYWYWVPSGPQDHNSILPTLVFLEMGFFLDERKPLVCFEFGPSPIREEGRVFISRRHI
jgi:hypothetical protein